MPLLGAHMSIAGHPHKALLRGKEIGCHIIQIFTRHRIKWSAKKLSEKEIDEFYKTQKETSIIPVAIHNSYLINLASPRSNVRKKSFSTLLEEMEWAELLKIPYLVMHPGSHMGDGEKIGLKRIAEAINGLHDQIKDNHVMILMEITAGQGTNLGYRFEHMAEIFDLIESRERLGVCFDTCHAFAAGYDFRSKETYRRLLGQFDKIIGLNRLKLFHINDSKNRLGSRVDRHEHPGEGFIGLQAFSLFMNDPNFADLPFLLETPKEMDKNGVNRDIINLNILRNLVTAQVDRLKVEGF